MNPPTSLPTRWDRAAIKAGAGVCAVFAVPLQVLAQLLGRDSTLAELLALLSLVGFVLGGGVAAWVQRCRLPLSHGIVTAAGTFAVVQIVFLLGRAVTGNDVRLGAALFNLGLVLVAGLFGGFLGQFLQNQGLRPRGRPNHQGDAS